MSGRDIIPKHQNIGEIIMEAHKILSKLDILEQHIKDKTIDIDKGMRDIIQKSINMARLCDNEDMLQVYYDMAKSQNKLLGENGCQWTTSSGYTLPVHIEVELQKQYAASSPHIIDSFQVVDPLLYTARNARPFKDGQEMANYLNGSSKRTLTRLYEAGRWNGNFPIVITELEEAETEGGEA